MVKSLGSRCETNLSTNIIYCRYGDQMIASTPIAYPSILVYLQDHIVCKRVQIKSNTAQWMLNKNHNVFFYGK